jgi:hypothetical protein
MVNLNRITKQVAVLINTFAKNHRMRSLLIITSCFLVLFTQAQQKKVYGYLRDSVTMSPIALASVTNLNSKTTVMTSSNGRFVITLSENDILSFAGVGYHFDTAHCNAERLAQDTLLLFLKPLARDLGNVTVVSRGWSRYQLDSMERRKDFLKDIANYTIPTVAQSNSGAGIALNIDRFSRHERNKRKAMAFFESNEKEEYINYRFPSSLVTEFTGLKGDALQEFMQRFRPTADWLRKNKSEEDIKYYLNDKLKEYHKKANS